MDQLKIGKFIADCRKQKNLTQMQLAEKLGITDKAISKWERGIAMPDTSIMLELCDILGISVNELLSGERIEMENNNQKNEQLLLDMAKELERKNKTIWHAMWAIMTVSIIGLLGGIVLINIFMPEGPWMLVAILTLCVIFLIPCFYALKLEISVGVNDLFNNNVKAFNHWVSASGRSDGDNIGIGRYFSVQAIWHFRSGNRPKKVIQHENLM